MVALVMLCQGCSSFLPDSGPSAGQIDDAGQNSKKTDIQVVDLTPVIEQRLHQAQELQLFSDVFAAPASPTDVVNPGDAVEVSLWEAPPATLFSSSSLGGGMSALPGLALAPATSQNTVLPAQVISSDGTIEIPFVGRLVVAGKTPREIEGAIVQHLQGKAHEPQALVRIVNNATANVTVVGEATNSIRMPLTPKRERLLDALAAAGGSRQPSDKISVQLTRGKTVDVLPLDNIIRDPLQDIQLESGDVITLLYQPFSFTAMGGTGKSDDIPFEAKGINLAQALARAGGLNDSRANAKGVFVFRFEPEQGLGWSSPHFVTPDGRVPVIYRVDLSDPSSFFLVQNFWIKNKDVVYVANAPAVEIEKFINLIAPITAPFINGAANGSGI